jgi:hypothetical protein
MLVLLAHHSNIKSVIDSHQHTILKHGSEFRPSLDLKKLLMHHPRWLKFQSLLETGSHWPLNPISEEERHAKNSTLIQRGNHQSAIKHSKILLDTLTKEVHQGWMVPIPKNFIENIPNAEVAPVGITQQWHAHEDGSRSEKILLTHDQSL